MLKIIHGIFLNNMPFYRDGWYHYSTRRILNIPTKFKSLLNEKAKKFNNKYRVRQVRFVIIIDTLTNIQAISIHHSHFDEFSESLGEKIVLGRINRYFGNQQWIKMKHKLSASGSGKPLYTHVKDENGKIIKKYIMIQRIKYFKPYIEITKFMYIPEDK